jgi:hypothetical protein
LFDIRHLCLTLRARQHAARSYIYQLISVCGIRENPTLVFIGFSNDPVDRVFRMPSGGKDVRMPRWFLPRPLLRSRRERPRRRRATEQCEVQKMAVPPSPVWPLMSSFAGGDVEGAR